MAHIDIDEDLNRYLQRVKQDKRLHSAREVIRFIIKDRLELKKKIDGLNISDRPLIANSSNMAPVESAS